MNLSMVVRLVDQFTQPARKLRDGLRGLATGIRQGFSEAIVEGLSGTNIDRAMANAEAAVNRHRGRLVGAFGQALALAAPVLNLGQFETQLVSFGNTAGIFGEDLDAVGNRLRALGPDVNKTAGELLTALDYLVGKGLSPDQGIAALEAVGMTATATGSQIEDMAASGFAVLDNLKVPARDLQQAFDAMAMSGKSGGFELKGMAQYFPGLTAQAQALKMEGVPAVAELGAALQIAMKAAGDESEGANNLRNFLSKLSSPETVKRFADMGVDIEAEFQIASDRGVSVFEHMLEIIQEKTGGSTFRMGELFGDQQVLSFLTPMMDNLEEFKAIRDAALGADGVNAGDFGRVMETWEQKSKAAAIQIDNLISNSSVLLEIAKDLATQVASVVGQMNAFATANPEVARTIVLAAAGLMTMSIALRILAFTTAGARLGLLGVLNTFLRFDEAGKNVAVGWRALSTVGAGLGGAFGLVKAAAIAVTTALAGVTAPVWAAVAVVLAAGFAVWKFWDRISSFVSGMASGLGEVLSPAVEAIGGAVDTVLTKLGELLGLDAGQIEGFKTGISDAFEGAFAGVGTLIEGAKTAMQGFWDWLGSFFQQETLSEEQKGQMKEAGRKLILDMLAGAQAAAVDLLNWFASLPGLIAEKIGSIDFGAMIFGGGQTVPGVPGAPGAGPQPPSSGGWGWNPFGWGQPNPEAQQLGAASMNLPPLGAAPGLSSEVNQTINAEVIDKRPPVMNVTVNQTITANQSPRAAGESFANAISQANTGALHDGS